MAYRPMVKTVTTQESGVAGDHRYAVVEVDITELDSAGTEPFDPEATVGLSDVHGAEVLDQEDYTYTFHFNADASTPAIIVKEVSGDPASTSDVSNNVEVGTVTLLLRGDWST